MDAEAPSKDAITDARRFLKKLNLTGLQIPKPGIAPTPDGGVLLIWEQGTKALEIEFEDSGNISYLFEDEENRISREESLSGGKDTEEIQNHLNAMYG